MKQLFYILSFLFVSCGKTAKHSQKRKVVANTEIRVKLSIQNSDKIENLKKAIAERLITFKKINGKAVVIGDNVETVDTKLYKAKTIEEGSVVILKGLSTDLLQETDDYCDGFYYVKINTDFGDRIVDGRNIYEISSSGQDTSFQYQNKQFSLKTTAFYGIGVEDDDGLTFCSKYNEPIVLINNESNSIKLVELIRNNISDKASLKQDFHYFELMANDDAYDKIEKIEQTDRGMMLTIKRAFQEGWNEYQVRLHLDGLSYKAEYLKYGKIKH